MCYLSSGARSPAGSIHDVRTHSGSGRNSRCDGCRSRLGLHDPLELGPSWEDPAGELGEGKIAHN